MTHKEFASTWFANIDNGNYEGLKSMMAANHSFHNPMSPAPNNADEHIGLIQGMMGSMQGSHSLSLVLADGDYIVVRGARNGKHTGDFNGIPASGKPISFTFTDIFHLENGKVAGEYMEMNPMAIVSQISG